MRRYAARRVLMMVPTAFFATVLIFLLMKMVPGDAAMAVVYGLDEESEEGLTQESAQEHLAQVRARLGLDKPLPLQYFDWIRTVGRGEFGMSIWESRPVREIIVERFPRTFQMAALILLITAIYGIPLGVAAALWQNSTKDHMIRLFTILGLSVPTIWIATLFLFTFSRYIGWIPPIEWKGPFEAPLHNFQIVVFPGLIVAYSVGSSVMRMTRSQMLEVIREDYIRTALAKGLARRAVVVRHALRNAILPVLTQFGGLFSVTILGLVITETLFHIPGMGKSMVDAISNRDYPVIQGFVLVNVFIVMVINLTVDLLYSVVDPRIRFA